MKDLAASVGAFFVSKETGLKLCDVKLEHLGTAKTIEVVKNLTTVVGGTGDADEIENRIDLLKNQLEQTESMYECERIQERITRLASGVAIIRVGGSTEVEMIEKKHRIEDALEAVRSAQLEGVVPGGGVALIRASKDLDAAFENEEQEDGMKIICEAVKAPVRQMAMNAGESPDIILNMVESETECRGYDFSKRQIVDMMEVGIIDPAKVTRLALQNAASVSSVLLTTNHAVVEI